MSIRSNALPVANSISPELEDVLRRNGMQAQVAMDGDRYILRVQGHDSPEISYNISQKQFRDMVDGGTNSANKRAYNTFVGIVSGNFNCPKNYIHARNVNNRVTMGLHGYRIQDHGMTPYPLVHDMPLGHRPPMLGWSPRQQDGFHMRRINGELHMMGSPMIPERENGYMMPGELQSGAYGFYYKGNQQAMQEDPLKEMQAAIKPVEVKKETPVKYRDVITSAVYFTNDKWQDVLRSHGFDIDEKNKKLTLTNYNQPDGLKYDLTDQQVKELTSNSLKGDSVYHRIDIINGVIGNDFQDKLTFDMLNSKDETDLHLKPEVEARLSQQRQQQNAVVIEDPLQHQQQQSTIDSSKGVNGQDLEEGKGWYRQVANGRAVSVGDIWVDKEEQQGQGEAKYKMSAVINGQVISHEISQKQYDKFLALDDYHRMKMFDKVFDEVKMKSEPGQRMSFGQALMNGLALAGAATRATAEIAHDIDHIRNPHPAPEVYAEEHRHGRIYVKAGLDSPESIASRAFEAGMNQGLQSAVMHHR